MAERLERKTVQPNESLDYIIKKYNIDLTKPSPFELDLCRKNELPALFKDLGFKVGAEVGVFDGIYSEMLCRANPELKLYAVDKWEKYPIFHNFHRQYHYNNAYETAKKRLTGLNCEIIKEWSQDAVGRFEDESLDFVFIDANHDFRHITEDLDSWSKKVRVGGIISGHDFGDSPRSLFCSVETVVRAWTHAYRIHPWFILKSPLTRDETSWMWVKMPEWHRHHPGNISLINSK
jgi:hypothetical protein